LEKTDTKSKDEIKVKKIKGRISEEEQNEIERIVKKNKELFLKEWNRRKAKVDILDC
jgi:alpha-ketoglutarate-dependent taurine dioxygenase